MTASPAAVAWKERAQEALAGAGHRAGGARRAVVSLLAEQECCLSAQQIHDRLRTGRREVGIASVYRAIEALEELGLIQRVDVGERGARYEPVLPGGEHHHHAVCEVCGEVTAFEDADLEDAIDDLARRLRHIVSAHEVVIHGRCPRCEGDEPASRSAAQ